MATITQEIAEHDAKLHKKWLLRDPEGVRLNWSEAFLENLVLDGLWLDRANMEGVRARNCSFKNATLDGINFHSASLQKANFQNAFMRRSNLTFACLVRANLTDADLSFSSLRSARLTHADLRGTSLYGVQGNGEEVKTAELGGWTCIWTRTPDGVDILQIGCQKRPFKEWLELTDDELEETSYQGPTWKKMYGPGLSTLIQDAPAVAWGAPEPADSVEPTEPAEAENLLTKIRRLVENGFFNRQK